MSGIKRIVAVLSNITEQKSYLDRFRLSKIAE
jgi:hypothetical protein